MRISFRPLLLLVVFALLSCKTEGAARLMPLPKGATILAFGDSLTFGTGAPRGSDYPSKLQQLLGLPVKSAAVPGEVSAAGLARLKTVLARERPALLILCHGGNDFLRRINATETKKNLRSMIRLAHDYGAQVLLIGVPRPALTLSPAADRMYAELAAELKVPLEKESLPNLLYDNRFKSDAVHLNAEGYARLAENIVALLRKSGALVN